LHNQAGFTLVEALVAVTLLSLLSIVLTRGLSFGIDAWTRGSAHSDQLSRTLAVQGLLRDVVGQAYPYFLSSDPTRTYVEFEGTSESLALLAPAPVALGSAGRSRFRLSTGKRNGLSDLTMTSQAELATADGPSTIEKKTLLTGVASVEFTYFGKLQSGEWYEMRIRLHPKADGTVDFVVAPLVIRLSQADVEVMNGLPAGGLLQAGARPGHSGEVG
jgi:general secretion pathway protein J